MTFVLRGRGCDPTVPAWVWFAWEERDALEWAIEISGDPTERRICETTLARLNGQLDRFWGAA